MIDEPRRPLPWPGAAGTAGGVRRRGRISSSSWTRTWGLTRPTSSCRPRSITRLPRRPRALRSGGRRHAHDHLHPHGPARRRPRATARRATQETYDGWRSAATRDFLRLHRGRRHPVEREGAAGCRVGAGRTGWDLLRDQRRLRPAAGRAAHRNTALPAGGPAWRGRRTGCKSASRPARWPFLDDRGQACCAGETLATDVRFECPAIAP